MTDKSDRLESAPPERMHALDAVRGYALLAGVAFHAALSFLPGPQAWLVVDGSRSSVVSALAFPIHMFRLATFFLIAGFFARMLIEKRGAAGFVRNRLMRIALPLLVFWPLVLAGIIAAMAWGASLAAAEGVPPAPPAPWPALPGFPLTHLWFLYSLLQLYAVALILRWFALHLDGKGRFAALVDAGVRRLASSPAAPLLLAVPLVPALASFGGWPMWYGIPTPDMSLIANLPATIAFSMAFLLGWLLHRQEGLIFTWSRFWPITLSLALVATVITLAMTGTIAAAMPPKGWTRFAYYFVYASGTWAWTMAVIGLALKYLSGHSARRRYIADASYWIYIVHLPIVMALQIGFARLPWSWAIKYPLILIVTFAIAFVTYHLLVRRTFIGALLNGRRYRRHKPADASRTAPASLEGLSR